MSPAHPYISIVVPTYARPKPLAACLQSLVALDYPRDRFEVIIVDDGSPTSPQALIAPFQAINLRLHIQQRRGPAAARNAGAAQAAGTLLAFTDDDCRPRADWLRVLADQFAGAPKAMVGGQVVNGLGDNLYATASQLLVSYLYDYYNTPTGQAQFFTSNNVALPTAAFHALGGFDASYPQAAAEDRDFCERWLLAGNQMRYAPEAVVCHAHALTLRSFWRQHVGYGRGAYRFRRGRAQRNQAPVSVEPATFYLDLLRYPFTHERLLRALPLAALMGVSQGANIVGYLWERTTTR